MCAKAENNSQAFKGMRGQKDDGVSLKISDDQLDKEFVLQIEVIRDLIRKKTPLRNLALCTKWLKIFVRTTKQEKFARNSLLKLMHCQLKEDGQLGEPFKEPQNCNRDLRCVLYAYKILMPEDKEEGKEKKETEPNVQRQDTFLASERSRVGAPSQLRVPQPSSINIMADGDGGNINGIEWQKISMEQVNKLDKVERRMWEDELIKRPPPLPTAPIPSEGGAIKENSQEVVHLYKKKDYKQPTSQLNVMQGFSKTTKLKPGIQGSQAYSKESLRLKAERDERERQKKMIQIQKRREQDRLEAVQRKREQVRKRAREIEEKERHQKLLEQERIEKEKEHHELILKVHERREEERIRRENRKIEQRLTTQRQRERNWSERLLQEQQLRERQEAEVSEQDKNRILRLRREKTLMEAKKKYQEPPDVKEKSRPREASQIRQKDERKVLNKEEQLKSKEQQEEEENQKRRREDVKIKEDIRKNRQRQEEEVKNADKEAKKLERGDKHFSKEVNERKRQHAQVQHVDTNGIKENRETTDRTKTQNRKKERSQKIEEKPEEKEKKLEEQRYIQQCIQQHIEEQNKRKELAEEKMQSIEAEKQKLAQEINERGSMLKWLKVVKSKSELDPSHLNSVDEDDSAGSVPQFLDFARRVQQGLKPTRLKLEGVTLDESNDADGGTTKVKVDLEKKVDQRIQIGHKPNVIQLEGATLDESNDADGGESASRQVDKSRQKQGKEGDQKVHISRQLTKIQWERAPLEETNDTVKQNIAKRQVDKPLPVLKQRKEGDQPNHTGRKLLNIRWEDANRENRTKRQVDKSHRVVKQGEEADRHVKKGHSSKNHLENASLEISIDAEGYNTPRRHVDKSRQLGKSDKSAELEEELNEYKWNVMWSPLLRQYIKIKNELLMEDADLEERIDAEIRRQLHEHLERKIREAAEAKKNESEEYFQADPQWSKRQRWVRFMEPAEEMDIDLSDLSDSTNWYAKEATFEVVQPQQRCGQRRQNEPQKKDQEETNIGLPEPSGLMQESTARCHELNLGKTQGQRREPESKSTKVQSEKSKSGIELMEESKPIKTQEEKVSFEKELNLGKSRAPDCALCQNHQQAEYPSQKSLRMAKLEHPQHSNRQLPSMTYLLKHLREHKPKHRRAKTSQGEKQAQLFKQLFLVRPWLVEYPELLRKQLLMDNALLDGKLTKAKRRHRRLQKLRAKLMRHAKDVLQQIHQCSQEKSINMGIDTDAYDTVATGSSQWSYKENNNKMKPTRVQIKRLDIKMKNQLKEKIQRKLSKRHCSCCDFNHDRGEQSQEPTQAQPVNPQLARRQQLAVHCFRLLRRLFYEHCYKSKHLWMTSLHKIEKIYFKQMADKDQMQLEQSSVDQA